MVNEPMRVWPMSSSALSNTSTTGTALSCARSHSTVS
jgi:hypothetical protein